MTSPEWLGLELCIKFCCLSMNVDTVPHSSIQQRAFYGHGSLSWLSCNTEWTLCVFSCNPSYLSRLYVLLIFIFQPFSSLSPPFSSSHPYLSSFTSSSSLFACFAFHYFSIHLPLSSLAHVTVSLCLFIVAALVLPSMRSHWSLLRLCLFNLPFNCLFVCV